MSTRKTDAEFAAALRAPMTDLAAYRLALGEADRARQSEERLLREAASLHDALDAVGAPRYSGMDEEPPGAELSLYERIRRTGTRAASGIQEALEVAMSHAGHDGEHHKEWVIDQMVRALTGPGYEEWVVEAKAGEEGPNTYDWSEGIPP